MNTQAIKIIDEMIQEHTRLANENPKFFDHNNWYVIWLKEARDKISSLPSLDIDSLWNYDYTETWMEYVWTAWMWEYIRYDDLKKLLQDTLELNQ